MERPEEEPQSYLNSWVVLSRTVQPENGDFRLNLRFVSPWNANSPQQLVRRSNQKGPKNLPGLWWIRFRLSADHCRHFFFLYFISCVNDDLNWLDFIVKIFCTTLNKLFLDSQFQNKAPLFSSHRTVVLDVEMSKCSLTELWLFASRGSNVHTNHTALLLVQNDFDNLDFNLTAKSPAQ